MCIRPDVNHGDHATQKHWSWAFLWSHKWKMTLNVGMVYASCASPAAQNLLSKCSCIKVSCTYPPAAWHTCQLSPSALGFGRVAATITFWRCCTADGQHGMTKTETWQHFVPLKWMRETHAIIFIPNFGRLDVTRTHQKSRLCASCASLAAQTLVLKCSCI